MKSASQQWEIEPTEKTKLKEYLTPDFVESLSAQGLKKELKELGLRAPETSAASMREVLLRIARTGTRLNELRARDRGRPSAGGQIVPPTGNSHMISEYLHQLLGIGIYLHNGELVGEGNNTCELSSDLGIRGCPSGGKREFRPNVRQMSVLWDNAPSHQPTTSKRVSPFQKWVQDKLGLQGVIHTPPYSAWFNPVELFFSYVKRYVRKFAPKDLTEMLQRIREATAKVDGKMIQGWFKKSGFPTGPEHPVTADPNEGVVNRCTLPESARFDRREHVVCADANGTVRREKRPRHTRWSKYDKDEDIEDPEALENVSVVKRRRSGVPRKRARVETCPQPTDGTQTRWVGISPEPAGLVHASYSQLYQNDDDMAEIERIVGERASSDGKKEYLVNWKNSPESHNEWLDEHKIQGLGSLLQYWRQRNKRVDEQKKLNKKKEHVAKPLPTAVYQPNRNASVGDLVAIYPSKAAADQFYVGRIIGETSTKFEVHWWNAKKVDGVWSEQHLIPKKGSKAKTGGPYTSSVWREAVVDILIQFPPSAKRGKVDSTQLKELIKLGKAHKKKKCSPCWCCFYVVA